MKYILSSVAAISLATTITSPSFAMNCVAYAREVTGMNLSGDAWHWWDSASGVYARGRSPAPGAVMVFQRTSHMTHGHVAVVREVLGSRHILIDQANWLTGRMRGAVTEAVSAIDVSPSNDWSNVQIQWQRSSDYGRSNPIRGFIYADSTDSNRPHLQDAVYQPSSTDALSDENDTDTTIRRGSSHFLSSHRVRLHHAALHHANCARKPRSNARAAKQARSAAHNAIHAASHTVSAHGHHHLVHAVAAKPVAHHQVASHGVAAVKHTPVQVAQIQVAPAHAVHQPPTAHAIAVPVKIAYHPAGAATGPRAVPQKPITHQISTNRG